VTGSVLLQTMSRPSLHLSLAFLTLGGFLGGVLFWGGINNALDSANSEKFCISCHEMQDNVYKELQGTIHWENRSGVRATCADCHVPHTWTMKVARKMGAWQKVMGKLLGTLATREKFLAMRPMLAQREWNRMAATKSAECRVCHQPESMDLAKQKPQAASAHKSQLLTGEKICIDCHKGIAHKLPVSEEIQGFD
jgi:cytochrome c-type protein NapC